MIKFWPITYKVLDKRRLVTLDFFFILDNTKASDRILLVDIFF